MTASVTPSCALKRTPLYEEHVKRGGRMVAFHGWLLPVQYAGIGAEHEHTRTAVSAFDTSYMGQFAIRGEDAPTELARLLTRDPRTLKVGRAFYCHMLNENGGIVDDMILMRLGPMDFVLVVNAGPRKTDFVWLRNHLYGDVELIDQSNSWGKIDVQGPKSLEAVQPLLDIDVAALPYFGCARARICEADCVVSRTGYTGELGYEMMIPNPNVAGAYELLMGADGILPAGLGARDILRLEMSYPLHGQDIHPDADPLEADLRRFISLEHNYVGAATLRDRLAEGLTRKLVAFKSDSRRKTHTGDPILAGDTQIGAVTSGGFSPSLQASIGLGYVAMAHAEPGTRLAVRTKRADVPVSVAEKPLYTGGTCRTRTRKAETPA